MPFDSSREDDLAAWLEINRRARDAGAGDPVEDAARFRRAEACLRLLRDAWPDPNVPAIAATEPSSGDFPETAPVRKLGRFEIVRELGRGGYGIVFLAFDPHLGREVALKVPRPETLPSEARLERFLHEARAAASLDHPNVVPVYEVAEIGPTCYIVSKYCPGGTLAEWLQARDEPVVVGMAARLAATLAEATAYVHGSGLLHRDIKPANVLLEDVPRDDTADGLPFVPRLADFGLARLSDASDLTRTGAVLGTPSYMAPEQAESRSAAIGPATDVYALGVVLYELLTGRPPYQGGSHLEVLQQISRARPVAPGRLRPGVPRDLEAICLKCLEYDVGRRYSSAGALAEDLQRFLRGEPVRARHSGPIRQVAKWMRRNPLPAALAASLLIAVGASSAIATRQWQAAADRQRAEENFRAAHRAVKAFHEALDAIDEDHGRRPQPARDELFAIAYRYFIDEAGSVDDPDLLADVADSHYHLAFDLAKKGHDDKAREIYEESLPLWKRLVASDPDAREARYFLGKTYDNLGHLHRRAGRVSESYVAHERALECRKELVRRFPDELGLQSELAYSLHNMGAVCRTVGRREDAAEFFEQAKSIRERLVRAKPGESDYRLRLADTLRQLAALTYERGVEGDLNGGDLEDTLSEVIATCRSAGAILEPMANQGERLSACTRTLGLVWQTLGQAEARLGNTSLALEAFERAAHWFKQAAEFPGRRPESLRGLASVYVAAAELQRNLRDDGRTVDFDELANSVLEELRRESGPGDAVANRPNASD